MILKLLQKIKLNRFQILGLISSIDIPGSLFSLLCYKLSNSLAMGTFSYLLYKSTTIALIVPVSVFTNAFGINIAILTGRAVSAVGCIIVIAFPNQSGLIAYAILRSLEKSLSNIYNLESEVSNSKKKSNYVKQTSAIFLWSDFVNFLTSYVGLKILNLHSIQFVFLVQCIVSIIISPIFGIKFNVKYAPRQNIFRSIKIKQIKNTIFYIKNKCSKHVASLIICNIGGYYFLVLLSKYLKANNLMGEAEFEQVYVLARGFMFLGCVLSSVFGFLLDLRFCAIFSTFFIISALVFGFLGLTKVFIFTIYLYFIAYCSIESNIMNAISNIVTNGSERRMVFSFSFFITMLGGFFLLLI